jgi:hypothetical protein
MLLFALATEFCFAGAMEFSLQPKTDIELLYNEFKVKDVELNNLSDVEINVSIIDSNTYKVLRSFTLDANSSKTMTIEETGMLKLYNPSDEVAKMSLSFISRENSKSKSGDKIKIVLANPSHKEYVLLLPSGSKPKLGPGSSTGMFFKAGDEIYFMNEGKPILLVTISKDMKSGTEINIHKRAKAALAE